jgi:hypothetical protein
MSSMPESMLDHFGLTGEDREAVVSFVESTKGDIVEA